MAYEWKTIKNNCRDDEGKRRSTISDNERKRLEAKDVRKSIEAKGTCAMKSSKIDVRHL